MDIDHLSPQQLSSDSTLSGWTLYPSPVFKHEGSCVAPPHHVNVHRHDYQQQYGHCQDAYYVTEAPQQSDLLPTDVPVSYWQSAQVPATGPLSTTLPMDPLCYFPSQSYYGNHELHYHTAPVDQFQSIPYATSYPDVSPSTPATAPSAVTAIPTFGPLPTIAPHQSESGHDLMPQDATTHSALYEGATTFQTTDTSYAQMGLYEDTYITTTGESHTQYAPALAQEWPQPQPFVATFTPTAQGQYVAPVSPPVPEAPPVPVPVPAPSPAPPARLKRKASSQSLGIRSRGRSPMGHLPYQEDIAKAGIKSRRSPDFSGRSSSPSSTPRPSSPVLQPLTFITYPDLEPKGHGRGGDCDGNGDDDDDDDSSRRGRRGKKQPKKEPFLACFFCRGRKIACHPKNDGGEDRTCTQCAKRRLECKYPQTSRRGQRKPPNTATIASTTTTACKPRAARASSKRSASSFGRI